MKTLFLFSILAFLMIAGISIVTFAKNGNCLTESNSGSYKCQRNLQDLDGEDDDPLPIRGAVRNVGNDELENVHVELYTMELNFIDDVYTDIEGEFQIDDVVPDTYKLYFNKEGYEELIKTIEVVGGTSYFNIGIVEMLEE